MGMKLKVFVVFDSKTEAYLLPHFFRSRGEAIRAYTQEANNPDSSFSKHSADFTFFEIGDYDDSTGVITMHETKANLGTALELKTIIKE